MTTVTTLPSTSRPLTRRDLEALPDDDGRRWELVDGTLFVSPAPSHRHQTVLGNLHLLLRAACPPGLQVVLAPFAVALADNREVQPDLLVAERDRFLAKELPGPPLLAVEVLSPSTRRVDLLYAGTGSSRPAAPPTGWSTPRARSSPPWSCATAPTSRSARNRPRRPRAALPRPRRPGRAAGVNSRAPGDVEARLTRVLGAWAAGSC